MDSIFEDSPNLLWWILIITWVVTLVVAYYFIRFTFRLKRQLWNQRQQLTVLMKIAEKLGVPKEEMQGIKSSNDSQNDYHID